MVAGEPGIDKTRLLHEVAERVEQVGGLVLRGGPSEAEGMPPYLPFLEALGGYIAVKNPLLLLLDDLHWADTATLDLLCHLARHQAVSRLCILGGGLPL